jgi:hypothetical protein
MLGYALIILVAIIYHKKTNNQPTNRRQKR